MSVIMLLWLYETRDHMKHIKVPVLYPWLGRDGLLCCVAIDSSISTLYRVLNVFQTCSKHVWNTIQTRFQSVLKFSSLYAESPKISFRYKLDMSSDKSIFGTLTYKFAQKDATAVDNDVVAGITRLRTIALLVST